ncbi:MAG: hypothetical protein M3O03_09180 [Pseudomonadota bacterium]|nr:hypothetical protein [Pseudomonadota bacterium]
MQQDDLFGNPQPSLFPEAATPVDYQPDPDKVRAKILRIIIEARSASTFPWDEARQKFYRTVIPQMSLWLPEEEAAQLRFEFDEEFKRLELAEAA